MPDQVTVHSTEELREAAQRVYDLISGSILTDDPKVSAAIAHLGGALGQADVESTPLHRVELDFELDSTPTVTLLHPPGGIGCEIDPETGECLLTDWVDAEGAELLRGEVVLPVRWIQDPDSDDHPLLDLAGGGKR